uniref:Uncharacterized protein n=1 Tax=Manihot esculenta TaxID=3983 RepID=A0A2C9WIB7_MANES
MLYLTSSSSKREQPVYYVTFSRSLPRVVSDWRLTTYN